MSIDNLKQFYNFIKDNKVRNVERFSQMYETVEIFCGGCRHSDYERALEELKGRYKSVVLAESEQIRLLLKDEEKLIFSLDGEIFMEISKQDILNQ